MNRLFIDELVSVGVVEEGDNPEATVAIWKRKPNDNEITYNGSDVTTGTVAGDPTWTDSWVVEKATKVEDGTAFPAADYAYVPDPNSPSTWKLRLTSTPGKLDARIIGAAVAALGKGFRGRRVQIPAGDLAGVKAKVRAAWSKVHAEGDTMPDILKELSVENAGSVDNFLEDVMDELEKTEFEETIAKQKQDLEEATAEIEKARLETQTLRDELAAIEKEKRAADMAGKAEALKHALGDPDVWAPVLDSLQQAAPEAYETLEKRLLELEAGEETAELFKELGSANPSVSGIDQIVADIRKANPDMSAADARAEAWKTHPELVEEVRS